MRLFLGSFGVRWSMRGPFFYQTPVKVELGHLWELTVCIAVKGECCDLDLGPA